MAKDTKTFLPAGHWSIDLRRKVTTVHVCPLEGGARSHSRKLEREGRWPPPSPLFELAGTVQDYSLFRRWLRHIWLECDAGIGVNVLTEADAGLGKSAFNLAILLLEEAKPSISRSFIYSKQVLMDRIRDTSVENESLFGDEALTKMIWGLGVQGDREQQEMYQTIWELARRNKKKVHYAAQDSKSASRIARAGICRYWVVLEKRNVDTGRKRGWILHGIRSPEYDRKAHGYKMERPFRYKMLGAFTAPGVGGRVMPVYEKVREIGLGSEESIDYRLDT